MSLKAEPIKTLKLTRKYKLPINYVKIIKSTKKLDKKIQHKMRINKLHTHKTNIHNNKKNIEIIDKII